MQFTIVFLFAFYAAASATSRSSVMFNKDGVRVAYNINHRAGPHQPSTFVSVHRNSPVVRVPVKSIPFHAPVAVHAPFKFQPAVYHFGAPAPFRYAVHPAALPFPSLALPYGLKNNVAPEPYVYSYLLPDTPQLPNALNNNNVAPERAPSSSLNVEPYVYSYLVPDAPKISDDMKNNSDPEPYVYSYLVPDA